MSFFNWITRIRSIKYTVFFAIVLLFSFVTSTKAQLPIPWQDSDIGGVATAGSAIYNNGIFTIEGSGNDIWNAYDEFHYVYQNWSGDVEIIVKVESLEQTNVWAKAGIMVRESLTNGSRHASLFVTPANGVNFQRREVTASTSYNTQRSGIATPVWLKINKTGSTILTSFSTNSQDWEDVGQITGFDLPSSYYIGLAVTAHNDGALCESVVKDVSINGVPLYIPPPFGTINFTQPVDSSIFYVGDTVDISAEVTLSINYVDFPVLNISAVDGLYQKVLISPNPDGVYTSPYHDVTVGGVNDTIMITMRDVDGNSDWSKIGINIGGEYRYNQFMGHVLNDDDWFDIKIPLSSFTADFTNIRNFNIIRCWNPGLFSIEIRKIVFTGSGNSANDYYFFGPEKSNSSFSTPSDGGYVVSIDQQKEKLDIEHVDFFADAELLGIDTIAPYSEYLVADSLGFKSLTATVKLSNSSILVADTVIIQVLEPPSNLVAHWGLDNDATDASGNNLNGTLYGNPQFVDPGVIGSHSVALNGADDYIDFGTSSLLPDDRSPRTMSAWLKTNELSVSWRFAVAYGQAVNSKAMFIGQRGTSLYGGAYGNDLSVANFWETGVWHHIVLTYDGDTASLYTDGVKRVSMYKNWPLALDKIYIGRQVNTREYWNGSVDDVQIFDKALNDTEIMDLYNQHLVDPSEGQIPDSDELQVLTKLYNQLKGESWINSTNWLNGTTSTDYTNWHGITVEDGDVTEIHLGNNGLKGEIPTDIVLLEALKILDLGSNELMGGIPVQISRLQNLEELYLNDNQFKGYVDLEFSVMPNIRVMALQNNNLISIPDFSFNNSIDPIQVTLNAENNNLEFYYIENNLNPDGTDILGTFTYEPQKPYGEPKILGFIAGDKMELKIKMLGSANIYQWEHFDGSSWNPIGGNTPSYVVNVASSENAGKYRCAISNTIEGTGFQIISEEIEVKIDLGITTEINGDNVINYPTN